MDPTDLIGFFAVSTAITGVLLASYQYLSSWVEAKLRDERRRFDEDVPPLSEALQSSEEPLIKDAVHFITDHREYVRNFSASPTFKFGQPLPITLIYFVNMIMNFIFFISLFYMSSATLAIMLAYEYNGLNLLISTLSPKDIVYASASLNVVLVVLIYFSNSNKLRHLNVIRRYVDEARNKSMLLRKNQRHADNS